MKDYFLRLAPLTENANASGIVQATRATLATRRTYTVAGRTAAPRPRTRPERGRAVSREANSGGTAWTEGTGPSLGGCGCGPGWTRLSRWPPTPGPSVVPLIEVGNPLLAVPLPYFDPGHLALGRLPPGHKRGATLTQLGLELDPGLAGLREAARGCLCRRSRSGQGRLDVPQ